MSYLLHSMSYCGRPTGGEPTNRHAREGKPKPYIAICRAVHLTRRAVHNIPPIWCTFRVRGLIRIVRNVGRKPRINVRAGAV
jgi:hypothetical protein